MNEIKVVGIDLAKSVFQVCVWMNDGHIVSNRKVSRAKLLDTIRQFPAGSMIAMEACATSHYWRRTFHSIGFQVRLISTQYVKVFTHYQKNDANDALAICETAGFAARISVFFSGVVIRAIGYTGFSYMFIVLLTV